MNNDVGSANAILIQRVQLIVWIGGVASSTIKHRRGCKGIKWIFFFLSVTASQEETNHVVSEGREKAEEAVATRTVASSVERAKPCFSLQRNENKKTVAAFAIAHRFLLQMAWRGGVTQTTRIILLCGAWQGETERDALVTWSRSCKCDWEIKERIHLATHWKQRSKDVSCKILTDLHVKLGEQLDVPFTLIPLPSPSQLCLEEIKVLLANLVGIYTEKTFFFHVERTPWKTVLLLQPAPLRLPVRRLSVSRWDQLIQQLSFIHTLFSFCSPWC